MTKEREVYAVYNKYDYMYGSLRSTLKEAEERKKERDKDYPEDGPHRIYKLTEVER